MRLRLGDHGGLILRLVRAFIFDFRLERILFESGTSGLHPLPNGTSARVWSRMEVSIARLVEGQGL